MHTVHACLHHRPCLFYVTVLWKRCPASRIGYASFTAFSCCVSFSTLIGCALRSCEHWSNCPLVSASARRCRSHARPRASLQVKSRETIFAQSTISGRSESSKTTANMTHPSTTTHPCLICPALVVGERCLRWLLFSLADKLNDTTFDKKCVCSLNENAFLTKMCS